MICKIIGCVLGCGDLTIFGPFDAVQVYRYLFVDLDADCFCSFLGYFFIPLFFCKTEYLIYFWDRMRVDGDFCWCVLRDLLNDLWPFQLNGWSEKVNANLDNRWAILNEHSPKSAQNRYNCCNQINHFNHIYALTIANWICYNNKRTFVPSYVHQWERKKTQILDQKFFLFISECLCLVALF